MSGVFDRVVLFVRSSAGIGLALCCLWQPALAALPAPTPAQQQAMADKQAKAAAEAEQQKQALAASMDAIAARWRSRAAANGWPLHPPVPVEAVGGMNTVTAQSSSSGQPGGQLGKDARNAPAPSERAGTAPPSADVKPAAPNNPPR